NGDCSMKPFRLELCIADAPWTLNEINRKHRKARWQHAKKWQQIIDTAILKAGGYPPKPHSKARIEFTRFSSRKLDEDNLIGSFKPELDALKRQRERKAVFNKAGKFMPYKSEILR